MLLKLQKVKITTEEGAYIHQRGSTSFFFLRSRLMAEIIKLPAASFSPRTTECAPCGTCNNPKNADVHTLNSRA